MVTPVQAVPITVPRSVVEAPQQTRSPTLSVRDWSPVIGNSTCPSRRFLSAVPINRRKPQSPPFHFIAKCVGVLLHAVTRKAIFATELAVDLDLIADAFVKTQKCFVF